MFVLGSSASKERKDKSSRDACSKTAQQRLTQQVQAIRERRNWLIHQLYIRQEYHSCYDVIETQLRETAGTCEYALYVKGLLRRMDGALMESMVLLQTATLISPENAMNRKQLGRAFYLLGRHEDAIAAFTEASNLRAAKGLGGDWEIPYSIGLCYRYSRQYRKAMNAFVESIEMQRHDCTYAQFVQVALLAQDMETAESVLTEALTTSPANPELLAMQGHLYLQLGNTNAAFDSLGRCLTIDPMNVKALVAASSIIQDGGDFDVALTKYRIVVGQQPDAPQVWNNIGACFNGKGNLFGAVACLRKSIFLYPFEWLSHYNLGVVFARLGRFCAALQCFNSAIQLNQDYAPAYMLMGVCLAAMKDVENACRAYDRALRLQSDFLVYLNYAATLFNAGRTAEATEKLRLFSSVWDSLSPAQRREQSSSIPGVLRALQSVLLPSAATAPPIPADPHQAIDAAAAAAEMKVVHPT